jgi:hypothetical protein
MFEYSISLGNLLTIITLAGGWLLFLSGLKGKIDLLTQTLSTIDKRMNSMENSIANLSSATVQIAKQEVFIQNLEQRIDRIASKLNLNIA